eukprot:UN16407
MSHFTKRFFLVRHFTIQEK